MAYWREEPLEVDGVLDGTWGRWAVEVKTGAVGPSDLRGLLEFTRRFPEYRPLLVGDARDDSRSSEPASRGSAGPPVQAALAAVTLDAAALGV